MSFKFGDKVQIVKLSQERYEENLYDGNDALHYEDEADMGDVGVVISEGPDWPEVAFKTQYSTCVLEVDPKDLMLHSDESEVVFLNNLMEIQQKCPLRKYATLEQAIEFSKDGIEVGCQDVSKEDAITIAKDILSYYKAE